MNTFEAHEERVWSLAVGKSRQKVVVAPGEPELSIITDLEIVTGVACFFPVLLGCVRRLDEFTPEGPLLSKRILCAPLVNFPICACAGGADSVLSVWADCTAEEDEAARALQEEAILAEQELLNKMAARNYERAVELCLKYERCFGFRVRALELCSVFTIVCRCINRIAVRSRPSCARVLPHCVRNLTD